MRIHVSCWLLLLACIALLQGPISQNALANECLRQGDAVGVFYVTKVAGAEHDGVSPGEQLCYRCRYGSRPMVMVFARKTGGRLTELVRRLDIAVAGNHESSLKGLVTMVGDDSCDLKELAAKVAKAASVKTVPVVVARTPLTGPENYKLAPGAAVTVVVAKDSQVVNTYTSDVDQIDIAAVMSDVKHILH